MPPGVFVDIGRGVKDVEGVGVGVQVGEKVYVNHNEGVYVIQSDEVNETRGAVVLIATDGWICVWITKNNRISRISPRTNRALNDLRG